MLKVKFKRFDANLPYYPPAKATIGSAGFDLTVVDINHNEGWGNFLLDTNIAVEIPAGYVGKLYERSSIYKHCFGLTNKVGIIDSDYRGSIKAVVEVPDIHDSTLWDDIKSGKHLRLFQLIIEKLEEVEFIEASELSETERGTGGYGSTGLTNTIIN